MSPGSDPYGASAASTSAEPVPAEAEASAPPEAPPNTQPEAIESEEAHGAPESEQATGEEVPVEREVSELPDPAAEEPFRFFSPTSVWNTEPGPAAALDPESGPMIAELVAEISQERAEQKGPGISTTSYGVPIYTVGPAQPAVKIRLTATTAAPALQAAWNEVPLPEDAVPSEGSDGTLVVWQPSTDRLWEFWRLAKTSEGWEASWGGAMEHVSSGPGVYGPGVWANSQPWWGSSASSMSIVGGLITLEDLERGRINHALAIAIPQVRAGIYSFPARRTDGRSTSSVALPEGAHLRLDPDLNLATIPMPSVTRMIAEAAQRYGIFVRDGAGVAHFFAQDPGDAIDPYSGPLGFFGGKRPGELLASFPWHSLQLLRMEPHVQR